MKFKKYLTILLLILLTFTFKSMLVFAETLTYYGFNTAGDNVSINKEASTKNKVAALPVAASIRLSSTNKHGTTNCSSGWYQVYYEEGKLGYICSKYLNVYSVSSDYSTDASFATQLNSFPDSYKPFIKALHAIYPNAKFQAVNTNLNWNSAVNEESYIGKNLINKSLVGDKTGWINPLAPTQTWDGGTFVAANVDMIKYYMDPRNFLNEKYVFVFEQLSFNNNTQSENGVKNLIASSFMANKSIKDNNNNDVSYENVLFNAGKNNNVSPYYLASKIIQEQGTDGSGRSISGNVDGYAGYYNYYNINSYKTSERNAVENGLYYASGSGKGATTYGRPWNTPYRAINGGASWIASGYINVGQDTQYSQKFDIIGPEYYSHQYMQNVQGAATEGGRIYNAYKKVNNYKNINYTFKIPVYNNMPTNTYFASIYEGVSTNKGTDNSINNYTNITSSNNNTQNNQTTQNTNTTITITVGDVNGDGQVNSTDLIKVKKHILGISKLSGNNLKAADTNNDGNVNSTDLIKVKKHILHIVNLGKRNI